MSQSIVRTLSAKRFDTYLIAAGFNHDRALKLYIWNAELGAAFHLPIQSVEVALRNCVASSLSRQFGHHWWQNQTFIGILDQNRHHDLVLAQRRIVKKNLPLVTSQMIAGLSFGFWVGMLHSRYNPQIWSASLRRAFPFLPPNENRHSLYINTGKIASFRNRISHHEPLFKADALKEHADILRVLSWLCPDTAMWIKPHCAVPRIVRLKP